MQNTQGNTAQSPPDGFVRCCIRVSGWTLMQTGTLWKTRSRLN